MSAQVIICVGTLEGDRVNLYSNQKYKAITLRAI